MKEKSRQGRKNGIEQRKEKNRRKGRMNKRKEEKQGN